MINYDIDYIETKYGHKIYIEHDDGWVALVNTMTDKIHEMIDEYNRENESSNLELQILQIKEKFGGLRYYYTITYDDDEKSGKLNMILKNIRDYTSYMESLSIHICEICGKYGELDNTNGWLKTVCEEHKRG